jgi:hypothetical protein
LKGKPLIRLWFHGVSDAPAGWPTRLCRALTRSDIVHVSPEIQGQQLHLQAKAWSGQFYWSPVAAVHHSWPPLFGYMINVTPTEDQLTYIENETHFAKQCGAIPTALSYLARRMGIDQEVQSCVTKTRFVLETLGVHGITGDTPYAIAEEVAVHPLTMATRLNRADRISGKTVSTTTEQHPRPRRPEDRPRGRGSGRR